MSAPTASPAIASGVETVCTTYREGHDLIQRIRAKRKARKLLRKDCPQNEEPLEDLEMSLIRGDTMLQAEFDRNFKRFGESYASGDQAGRETLKGVNIHLQQQVISKLKLHWQKEVHVDLAALKDVSDSALERCTLALMQLAQRVVTSATIEGIAPPPLNINTSPYQRPLPAAPISEAAADKGDWGFEFTRPRPLTPPHSPPATKVPFGMDWTPQSTFAPPASQPAKRPSPPTTSAGPKSVPLVSAASQQTISQQNGLGHRSLASTTSTQKTPSPPATSHERDGSRASSDSNTIDGSENQYKPLATTTQKVGFFGIRKKKVEMIPDVPENPLVDKYLNEAIEDETRSLRRGSFRSGVSGVSGDAEESSIYPYHEGDDDNASILTKSSSSKDYPRSMERVESNKQRMHKSRQSTASRAQSELLSSSRPLASISASDLLPNELNNYAGFCKGAWRQQIGDRKKAMEERVKPGNMYNTLRYWQCKQCKFEGRYATPKTKKDPGYDQRIARLAEGIQFRWEFLFKSHVASSNPVPDPAKGTYGCVFCCAEGRGTPVFEGVVGFVRHLVEHRDRLPTGDVLYRMNCLVGRQASAEEEFDINIMSREGGVF